MGLSKEQEHAIEVLQQEGVSLVQVDSIARQR